MRQLHHIAVLTLLSAAVSLLSQHPASGQGTVGIGLPFRTQAPNPKAVLHIEADPANPQGVLLPRLSRTRLVGLTTAENGMLLYDPTDNAFHYWLTDRWMPLAPAVGRQTWLSGTASPDDTKGRPGDFYYQTDTGDLYQKNDAGVYMRLFTLQGDGFWQAQSATTTHTTRNVGIGIANPTERLVVDGAVAATSLQGADTRLMLADAGGKLMPMRTGSGYLANDGNGNLIWQSVNTYTAGNGINISSGTIFNTGDTNLSDDITVSTPAGGDLRGYYPNPVLASSSVTQAKIANGAVTTAKLADGSVTLAKLANNSVGLAKIQPAGTPNTFLSTNASGVVEWRAIDGSLPDAGEISIGNGVGVNQVALSQDATLATNGQVTVTGLLGRPLDNLSPPVNGQVLFWNGTQWTYSYVDQKTYADGDVTGLLNATTVTRLQNRPVAADAPLPAEVLTWNGSVWVPRPLPTVLAAGTLEGQLYTAPQNRYYSIDPTDFVETNSSTPHVQFTGPLGESAVPEQTTPGYLAAPLHLPHRAVVTEIKVYCNNDVSNTAIGASLVRNGTDGRAAVVALGSTLSTTGNETITLSSLPAQLDCQTYSYKIVVAITNARHRVHGVRITYTVNSPD